jgi:mycothiol synthase
MESQTITLRPPTLSDLPELTGFFAAIRDEYGSRGSTQGQLRDQLTSKHANVEENYRLAIADDEITGWVSVWYPEPTSERFFFHVEAHPRDGTMYRQLLEWAEERVLQVAAGRKPRMDAGGDSGNEPLLEELRRRGYALVRYFFDMEIDLAHEPADPMWPDGITLRTFEPGDERTVYDADMEASEDHWDFFTVPFEDWCEYFVESSEFDPTLWFLAEDGGELAGFALCTSERRPDTGYVSVLGVRRPWRRRGLGTALLLHAFHELRRRGRAKADLNVDADSLTGAVRLYERAGMQVVRRYDSYRRQLT